MVVIVVSRPRRERERDLLSNLQPEPGDEDDQPSERENKKREEDGRKGSLNCVVDPLLPLPLRSLPSSPFLGSRTRRKTKLISREASLQE